jgi:hypothetical protein
MQASALTLGEVLAVHRRAGNTMPGASSVMSYFPCSQCGCVEDTALCHYWSARLRQLPPLCSACDPKIGKWHGQFPQEPAANWVRDERGLVCSKAEVERWLGQPIDRVA